MSIDQGRTFKRRSKDHEYSPKVIFSTYHNITRTQGSRIAHQKRCAYDTFQNLREDASNEDLSAVPIYTRLQNNYIHPPTQGSESCDKSPKHWLKNKNKNVVASKRNSEKKRKIKELNNMK